MLRQNLQEITDERYKDQPVNGFAGTCDRIITNAINVDYSLQSYAILFFTYSFVGWLWELILFLIFEHDIVNTGMLHGPWLPIYGVGGVAALELLKNIRYSPKKTFVSIMLVAGVLEYVTHFATEKLFGFTWWDYSDYLLSINDRICIEGLVAFGALGCLAIYVISPKLNNLISKEGSSLHKFFITVTSILFFADVIFSLFVYPNMQNIY